MLDSEESGRAKVSLSSLRLGNFRNYAELSLDITTGPVVLVGPNGGGKTNIMEAISLFAPGRGLRRARADLLPYHHNNGNSTAVWSVSADVMTEDGPISCGTGVLPQDQDSFNDTMIGKELGGGNPRRRVIKINGEFASQTALAEQFAVSWMTPDMDDILASSPSERRRFLDRLVVAFDPAHAGRLQRFEKLYRQRNKLFDDGNLDASWFDAIEAQMGTSGMAIIAARQALVDALDIEAAMPVPMFPSARLSLEGDAEEWLRNMPSVEVEDRICGIARSNRKAGLTAMPGPMNSILTVVHSDTGKSAEMSSTGEQKALVISIILAHARLQSKRLMRPPILLLDDIASHLDSPRQQALFELTAQLSGQVWFSGTELAAFKSMTVDPNVFLIEDGRVAQNQCGLKAVRRR